MSNTIYQINVISSMEEKFIKKSNALIKRALKIGIKLTIKYKEDLYVYNIKDGSGKNLTVKAKSKEDLKKGTHYKKYKVFMVNLIMPDLNGLKIVAKLENTPSGNIINVIDKDLYNKNSSFKSSKFKDVVNIVPICDHCNKNRKRKYFYLVYNENTGEFMRIGKACLRNYNFSIDTEKVYNFLNSFSEFIEYPYIAGNHYDIYINTFSYLSIYLQMMYQDIMDTNNVEYIKNYDVYEEGLPDAEYKIKKVGGESIKVENRYWKKYKDYLNKVDDDVLNIVNSLKRDYVKDNSNVDLNNLNIVINDGVIKSNKIPSITYNLFKYAKKYMIEKYKKGDDSYKNNEGEKINLFKNEKFGEVGKKYTNQTLLFKEQRFIMTDFGGSYLVKFLTLEGNILTWFTNKDFFTEKLEYNHLLNRGYSSENIENLTDDDGKNLVFYPKEYYSGKKINCSFIVKGYYEYNGEVSTNIKRLSKLEIIFD